MPDYRYELCRGDDVIATVAAHQRAGARGRRPDRIGTITGVVGAVTPVLHERELHLVLQIWRESDNA
jgi:hypothetical protein